MQKNDAKVALSIIKQLHGVEATPIVKYLQGKKDVSEFKIAEKTKTDINFARRILYNLYQDNLVTYIKKKDKERGWTVSYWTFNIQSAKALAKAVKRKKIESLKLQLKEEESCLFYLCENDKIRMKFDIAAENEFKCPECGAVLKFDNNSEKIQKIREEIKSLE